jgi:hypothetical protein
VLDLPGAVVDEVARVGRRALAGDARLVRLLVDVLAGDAKVLQPRHQARAVGRHLSHELRLGQVEADVPVELPVVGVPRVALVARPDLLARLDVAREEGDAGRARDGRVDAVRGPRARVGHAVRVEHGVADARARDRVVVARVVGALREPGARRPAPHEPLEAPHAELELRPDALARGQEARQVAVGGRARQELQAARVPVPHQARDDVPAVPVPHGPHPGEVLLVEGRDGREPLVAPETPLLLLGQGPGALEVPLEALAEERVLQHRRQGRRDAHRQREGHAVVRQAVERVEERQVTLDDRLVEPALLEVPGVLGMPHERQVRVKDEGQVAGGARGHGLRGLRGLRDGSAGLPRGWQGRLYKRPSVRILPRP